MSRLGLLDQLMFKLEEGGMSPMHMCGAIIVDPTDSPYPVNGRAIADHLAACMEDIPLMRQKLIQDPLKLGDLRLVDDPGFDVHKHVTLATLPAPGEYAELTEALGRFSASPMDLSRPLWHFKVIEGMASGKIAIALRIHHAILDGSASQQVLGAMWSEKPVAGRKPANEARKTADIPSPLSLMNSAIWENMQRLYVQAPRFLVNNAAPLLSGFSKELSRRIAATETDQESRGPQLPKVRKTSLNTAPLSPERAVAYLELPLDEMRALRKSFDCSINDLALLLSSYALEHYFSEIGEEIDFDLIAGMPIDVRTEGDTSAGNALSLSRVNLHNTIRGIARRLQAISRETTMIKHRAKSARPRKDKAREIDYKSLTTLFSPLTLDALIYGIVKFNLMDKATLINVAVSNVPGPQTPVYVAGARLCSQIPMGPCTDSLALNITASSTDQHLILGFHGCAGAIRDKELLVEGARRAFRSLKRSRSARR